MQGTLEGRRVVAVDHGVHVEGEGDARVAELAHPVDGVEASGQADLDHAFAERADIGDHVDIAGAGLLGQRLRPLGAGMSLGEIAFQDGDLGAVGLKLGTERRRGLLLGALEQAGVARLLFLGTFQIALQLLLLTGEPGGLGALFALGLLFTPDIRG